MANKYDLKTWNKAALASTAAAAANGTNIGSEVVPAGKTRFLTYIRVNRTPVKGTCVSAYVTVRIASVTHSKPSHTQMVSGLKMMIQLPSVSKGTPSSGNVVLEQVLRGSVDHPILSVAGGNCMGINTSNAGGAGEQDVDVHAEYYDE